MCLRHHGVSSPSNVLFWMGWSSGLMTSVREVHRAIPLTEKKPFGKELPSAPETERRRTGLEVAAAGDGARFAFAEDFHERRRDKQGEIKKQKTNAVNVGLNFSKGEADSATDLTLPSELKPLGSGESPPPSLSARGLIPRPNRAIVLSAEITGPGERGDL